VSGQVGAPPSEQKARRRGGLTHSWLPRGGPTAGRPAAGRPAPRRRSTAASRRTTRTGLALISPALAFVIAFALIPLGFGVYISLTNWPLVGAYHFIGLANYTALVHNSVFLQSIRFTLEYTGIVTLPILVFGYALAVFVRANRPGSTVFRTMIFLPYIVGLVAESFMAVVELQPDSGTVNFVLAKFGIVKASTAWLVHTGLALTAISVLVIWFASGLTMMLLMAGMQGVPVELYESARVDGASWWSAERRITIPLMRRSIALSLIISVVYSFLAFNQFFIMTDGGPGTSTESVVMAIYQTAFADFNVGLASAMSVVLIIVVGLITFIQFRFLQGEGD
jgi:multiple sugar transport system permease protein